MAEREILFEKLKAFIPVQFLQKVSKFLSTAEDIVEFVVTEAYHAVVSYSATVINLR